MSTSGTKKLRKVRGLIEACGAVIDSVRQGKGAHKVVVIRRGDRTAHTVVSLSNNGSRNERNQEAEIRRIIRDLSRDSAALRH
jgi:hypothetical protein